jgi:hypothetical protein
MKKLILNPKVNVKKLIPGNKHYFFGYYGKSPFNKDEKYAVVLEVDFIDRHPKKEDTANIILIDLENNKKEKIAETKAWNWQQGCMLQWLGPDFNSKIFFNDRKGRKFISRIINIKTKKEKIIDYPLYDVSPDGKYGLSISFEKLNLVRKGYGYEGESIEKANKKIFEGEGIYLINLTNSKKKFIVNLKDLYNYKYLKSMDKGKHWIDQPVFNPKGDKVCFLHRWNIEGGLFHTRFFTVNRDGSDLFMFPDSGFYSHFTWRNSKEILVFCSVSEKFGNVRKGDKKSRFLLEQIRPIYRKLVPRFIRKRVIPIGYYLLKDQTKLARKINIYNDDGHPSFSPNQRYVITDTYPNSKRYRKLILYNWQKNKRIILGSFYSLPNKKYIGRPIKDFGNSPFRVDLHPRWDWKSKKVCFDSIHEGYRNIYEVDIKNLLNNYFV